MVDPASTQEDESIGKSVFQEVEELKGKSWFDVEVDHRRIVGRLSLTRIVLVSLIKPAPDVPGADFASTLPRVVSGFSETPQELTGGIVLVSDSGEGTDPTTALFCFLEASPEVVYNMLRKLVTESLIHSCRVILASDDCPSREFGPFGLYSESTMSGEDEVDIEAEGVIEVTSRIMTRLCKEATNFPGGGNVQSGETPLMELVGPMRKAIPSAKRVTACALSELFPTVEEFLEIFDSPIFVELESEMISPLQLIVDYNALPQKLQVFKAE